MKTWITDNNGNRCSVDYWGSEGEAREALASLKNCSRCSDCSDCSRCSDCSDCSYCSRCSRCSDCSYCSRCSRCSDCSYCSDCSDCSYCSDCSGCSGCSRCSGCSYKRGEGVPSQLLEIAIPKIDNLNQKVFAAASQADALDMSGPHTCETTHCRAGWIVHLAGEPGYALEKRFNWELAAMLIARKSGSPINPARFYDGNADALADMKRLAEQEAAIGEKRG